MFLAGEEKAFSILVLVEEAGGVVRKSVVRKESVMLENDREEQAVYLDAGPCFGLSLS